MKTKILSLFLLILFSCVQGPEIKTQNGTIQSIDESNGNVFSPLIDAGCHGGAWYTYTNILDITPWNYNENLVTYSQVQLPHDWNDMAPLKFIYRITNISGPGLSPTWIVLTDYSPPITTSVQGGAIAAGTYKDVTITVPTGCLSIIETSPNVNTVIFTIKVKFAKGPGSGPNQVSGGIQSINAGGYCNQFSGIPYNGCLSHSIQNPSGNWTYTLQ